MPLLKPSPHGIHESLSRAGRRDFLRLAVSGAALLAAPALCGCLAPAWASKTQSRSAIPFAGESAEGCASGDPASYTPSSADRAGMFLLFSDVHFDPFAAPGTVKALAAAPASAWGGILAEAGTAYSPYGQDSNNALFQSFLDDMARRAPRPDFLLFPGDLLCHRFWTLYPQLTGDSSREGLLNFIGKTAEYFLTEVTRRFPDAPLYLALGNNDSVEGDFRIVPNSPYLSVTASIVAQRALKSDADRAVFLESYPGYGCYSLPLPGSGNARIVVFNNIFWAKNYPGQSVGRPVLDYLDQQLTAAGRRGESVWLLSHVPPGDNSKASAAKYLKKGKDVYSPLLADTWNDALANLLVTHSRTVKACFCGHVHRDEFRLVYPKGGGLPAASMRLGPSISPVTGNNPGYQVYSYDRQSFELLDTTVHYLDIGSPRPGWDVEYRYSQAYGRGLRSPRDWQEMYRELKTCQARRNIFEQAFDLRSAHIDEVNSQTFPIFWDGLGLSAKTAI